MNPIAQFHFELADNSKLKLTYNLQENPLTSKWINVIRKRKRELTRIFKQPLELKITNKTEKDLPFLIEKLNGIVDEINLFYDKQLPLFKSLNDLDHTILNYLHEEFEEYGLRHSQIESEGYVNQKGDPDIFPGNAFRVDFHQLWLDLNQWIHITESAMENNEFPNFSCLIQYLPFEDKGAPIDPVDKLFLDKEFNWGELYLGYNTLGKDYMHAFQDDDKRVILNDQVKVQEWLSSEVWLNFSTDNEGQKKQFELEFYNWWRALSEAEKIPFVDIDTLALGRYYLGEISFDETFLKYHPVEEDWRVRGSDLRRAWNTDVFSKIVRAVGVEIING